MSMLGRPGSLARYGECGSLHSAQARRSCLSDLDWLQDIERSRHRRPDRSGDSRCRRGISARHYCRSAESEVGWILFRLHPAIYRTTADVARQFVTLGDRFSCAQCCCRCGRDPFGRHSMSGSGQATICPRQNATAVWCSYLDAGIFTSSFTSCCAAAWLIALRSNLSAAACLPTLQRNLSAVCSGKTTPSMNTTACLSRSPGTR